MKKRHLMILLMLFYVILLAFIHDAEAIEAPQRQSQFMSYIKLGIEKTLNMEFQNANAYLQKAVEMDPDNPAGYAYLSMMNLFAYEMNFDENIRNKSQASMLRYVEETLKKGIKRIENNNADSQTYMVMAVAKITKVNWLVHQKRYVLMAYEASSIWEYLEKAREGDPLNYDIYFLTGEFHYHIEHLPGLTRFLSSLIITSGDRQKGLQELELAALKGNLHKQLALSELSSTYLNFEKQPARALPIVRELKEKFPDNYNYAFALGNVLSELRRFEDALAIAREIDKKIQAGVPPFKPQLQPRYNQLMGRIFFNQGDYVRAEEYLQKGASKHISLQCPSSGMGVPASGNDCDAHKERNKAEMYYSKALDVEGGEGVAQIEARKYLKTPYVPSPMN